MSVHPNLLLHMPFQGDCGDASGRGNHGTPTNLAYVKGKMGLAGSFGGTSVISVAQTSGIPRFNSLGPISIACWIYPTLLSSYQSIYSEFTAGGSTSVYFTLFGSQLYYYVRTNSSIRGVNTTGSILAVNNWYFVTMTDSGSAKDTKFYVNGVPQAVTLGITTYGTPAANSVYVGTRDPAYAFYNGLMSDLSVWSTVIRSEDIDCLMCGDTNIPTAQ